MFYKVSLLPEQVSQSEGDCLYSISSRNIKKKNTSKYHFIETCTDCTQRENNWMQRNENKKLKQTAVNKDVSVIWL